VSRSGAPLDESPATVLTHHVVVPAAVIAMAASFLFYLADLRSAFLGGSRALKWVGFCFVVATVLNERYGRSSRGDAHLQRFFTLSLAGATLFVMLVAPWETPRGSFWLTLANLLILAVIWHFATRVTRELSPEIGSDVEGKGWFERDLLLFDLNEDEKTEEDAPRQEAPPARPRNPAATVARLAAAALLTFALSEPIVLGAAAQTGAKALAAIVVFLFSTGVVLAAGSALDALRRVESAGGRVAPGLVPGRLALAALLLGGVLASALALPGLSLQGTGRLRPPTAHGEGAERERGNQETDHAGQPNALEGSVFAGHFPASRRASPALPVLRRTGCRSAGLAGGHREVAAPRLDPDSPGSGNLGARPALAPPEGLESQGQGSLARSPGPPDPSAAPRPPARRSRYRSSDRVG
jgi:hypothetical protein